MEEIRIRPGNGPVLFLAILIGVNVYIFYDAQKTLGGSYIDNVLYLTIILLVVFVIIFFFLREYKTLHLTNDTFKISSTFFLWLYRPNIYKLSSINHMKFVGYSFRSKAPQTLQLQYRDADNKNVTNIIKLRAIWDKEHVQRLIDEFRRRQIEVECEGDVWR